MCYNQILPKSSLKLRFVLFKPEKVSNVAGISNPPSSRDFLRFEKDKPQFQTSFSWKLTIVHKDKIKYNEKLIFKKNFRFPKFPLFHPLASFDLNFLESPHRLFFNSFIGKFFVIGFLWSYSFQILSEIRHWFWDLGYGFELKTSKVTGILVIVGSILITVLIYSNRGILV